jgi:tRNA dimethylallyltransferase
MLEVVLTKTPLPHHPSQLLSTAAGPKPKVLVLGGPSAVGKSTVAYNIAKEHNGVVISADAVKVYKRLQLGTNKQPFEGVPLKMTDIIEPNDLYTVHDYASDAMAEIRQVSSLLVLLGFLSRLFMWKGCT